MQSIAFMHVAVLCALLAPATVYGAGSTPAPSPTAPPPTVSPPPMPVFAYASPPAREQEVPADATAELLAVKDLLDASDFDGAIAALRAYVDDPSRTDADAMDMANVRPGRALTIESLFFSPLLVPRRNALSGAEFELGACCKSFSESELESSLR
jgi:hypothetical protein